MGALVSDLHRRRLRCESDERANAIAPRARLGVALSRRHRRGDLAHRLDRTVMLDAFDVDAFTAGRGLVH